MGKCKKASSKTVANAHGLLSAVLKEYKPSMALRTTLPSKVKAEIQIPSEAEIKAIMDGCRETKYELPIMLAIWLGLRESEILGLEWKDINGDYLKIRVQFMSKTIAHEVKINVYEYRNIERSKGVNPLQEYEKIPHPLKIKECGTGGGEGSRTPI